MKSKQEVNDLIAKYIFTDNHSESDYFGLIRELLPLRQAEGDVWQKAIDQTYGLLLDEMKNNENRPTQEVSFGTSGWRGKLGKDVFVKSAVQVTQAIIDMYAGLNTNLTLAKSLGVETEEAAKNRGCVVGFDNRFGGELLGVQVVKVLVEAGYSVYYAGESTTGALSAAVLELNAAFSINLTPSHNPLDYGGYKFNAADGGPAAASVTETITANVRNIIAGNQKVSTGLWTLDDLESHKNVTKIDTLKCWKDLVSASEKTHGLSLAGVVEMLAARDDIIVAVDCVHGASRLHIKDLFDNRAGENLQLFRDTADVTFGGVAPEPSSDNIAQVHNFLGGRSEKLRIGAIIDPDGDRIRFTDGIAEISMNQFGAMAYHFLHQKKDKRGMVAKTVATSNLANKLADAFSEELFEPSVGFKNFKPVIGKALVIFEESDGISIIGHTPEKDAYIGLLLALEIVMSTGLNLSEYLGEIEREFGAYYPERDGVVVPFQGKELLSRLDRLSRYENGSEVQVGGDNLRIANVITIDGRKMVFGDGSWLMIRPSGTEPKVRFYVESRTEEGTADLVATAMTMLEEVGVLEK